MRQHKHLLGAFSIFLISFPLFFQLDAMSKPPAYGLIDASSNDDDQILLKYDLIVSKDIHGDKNFQLFDLLKALSIQDITEKVIPALNPGNGRIGFPFNWDILDPDRNEGYIPLCNVIKFLESLNVDIKEECIHAIVTGIENNYFEEPIARAIRVEFIKNFCGVRSGQQELGVLLSEFKKSNECYLVGISEHGVVLEKKRVRYQDDSWFWVCCS